MSTLLDRHVGRGVFFCVLLSWLFLLSVFSFFRFVEQLGDIGTGIYGLRLAIYYTLFSAPHTAYELLPIAVAVGAMTSLGMLANNGELAVIRGAGVSRFALARSLLRAGVLLAIAHLALGELLAPSARRHAIDMRSAALTGQTTAPEWVDFWTVNSGQYINIKKLLPNQRVEDIDIYEFDDDNASHISTHASSGYYRNGQWVLQGVVRAGLMQDGVETLRLDAAVWDIALEPEMVVSSTNAPQSTSIVGALRQIHYMRRSHQDSTRYSHVLFMKLLEPFSVLLMLLLALAMVRVEARDARITQCVGLGSLLGIVWHITRDVCGNMGIVYGIHPLLSVALPPAALLTFILWRLTRLG